jgi:enoyl-CoA hydratase
MTDILLRNEPEDGVLVLTMNRPDARNAISLELADELADALAQFKADDQWRAGILAGAPPAFCAGLDLKSFSAPDSPRHKVTELITSLPHLGKPLIAAVGGAAMTGGLELVLSCDFAIASPQARFADTHARIGALSGSGMASRLPRTVGVNWAKQMMLTCAPVDAATALRIGLVNEVVGQDELIPRAIELAKLIASHNPDLVSVAKGVIDSGFRATLDEALEIEQRALAKRKASGAMEWKK